MLKIPIEEIILSYIGKSRTIPLKKNKEKGVENVAFSISQSCGPELHWQGLSLDLNMVSGSLKI